MSALNFPDPNVTQDYSHTDDQGTVVNYKWNAARGLWQAVSVTGYSFPEAPNDGEDYVRNSEDWLPADYFSGDYSDLANTPDIPTDNSELTNGAGYITAAEAWVVPAGTRMIFDQATVPAGWTLASDKDNHALRVVSSSGGSTGGSQNFTACFQNRSFSVTNVSGSGGASVTVPTTDEANPGTGGLTDEVNATVSVDGAGLDTNTTGSHSHPYKSTNGTAQYGFSGTPSWFVSTVNTDRAGGGQAHGHGLSQNPHRHYLAQSNIHSHTFGSSASGSCSISGGTGGGSLDLAVKYTNICIGVKS